MGFVFVSNRGERHERNRFCGFVFDIFEIKTTKPEGLFDQLPRTKSEGLPTTLISNPEGVPETRILKKNHSKDFNHSTASSSFEKKRAGIGVPFTRITKLIIMRCTVD